MIEISQPVSALVQQVKIGCVMLHVVWKRDTYKHRNNYVLIVNNKIIIDFALPRNQFSVDITTMRFEIFWFN